MDTKNNEVKNESLVNEIINEIEATETKEVKKTTLQKIDDFKKDHPVLIGVIKTTIAVAVGIGIGAYLNRDKNSEICEEETIVLDDLDVIIE